MTPRPIRFFHRGGIASVDGVAATRSVLDWLREDVHCTGTKEGCAEGDCGACTVVLGQLDDAGGLRLRPVNACIQFMPTLDGQALFTVEDLQSIARPAPLHPVQQALVSCHGSQCGFCTPGFAMSLWASYERGLAHRQAGGGLPSRQQLADDLSGNLCRCTGYRPILDAAEQMFVLPPAPLDTQPVIDALRQLRSDPPLNRDGYTAPHTLDGFAAQRLAHPEAQVLAGCTDVGLWVTKQFRPLPHLLYIGKVAELRQIEEVDKQLRIGAAVSLEDAYAALVARWPSLQDLWLRFASPPIRHAGTLGGNIANGSPIGDSAPVLMALGARIVLRRGDQQRTIPLREFYTGYMRNQLQPGEFVQALQVPLPSPGQQVRAHKISKRFDCDISAVCAGLSVTLDGSRVRQVSWVFGGMAATVCHAERAEAAARGQPWDEATLQAAQAALADDYTPLTDMRASAAYRLKVAQNLLRRFWLETRPDGALAAGEVSVWRVMARTPVPVESAAPGGRA